MVLTQLALPYGCLMPCISNYVYKEIRNWALIWQPRNHRNNGPSKGFYDLEGLKWHTLPMETYHLQMPIWINSSIIPTIRDIAKISLNIEIERHMCDFRHRRVDFLWHVWIVCWKLSCFLSLTFVFCFSCGRSAVGMWTTVMFPPHSTGFLWALGTFFSLNNWENPSLRLKSYIIILGGQRPFGNMHTSDLKEVFIRWKTLHRRNWHHPWSNLC